MLRKSSLSIVIIVLGMLVPATLFTQDEGSLRQLYNSIEKLLSEKEYDKAIPLLTELVKTNPNNANYNFKMAYAIIRGNSKLDPLPFLEKAITNTTINYKSRYTQDAAPIDALWFYALQRYYRYDYAIAKDFFTKYLQLIPSTHTNYAPCVDYIGWCNTGPEFMKKPVKVKHVSFHEATTLPEHFHSALFSPDESIFIFTGEQNPNIDNYKIEYKALNDDIFYIINKNGKWSEPASLSSNINSARREACIGMNPNGKQLLIYREDADGGNIYYSDLLDSSVWSTPKKFPEPINSLFNESHATLSADGRTIFFTSDRPGGFGGLDIYMSIMDLDGTWGPAINLGSEVNSSAFEESPHIQVNSNLLYFSSNRPGGLGEFDVYRTELKNDSIAFNVQNIGYPINTPRNDLFFKTSIDGGKAYYSSPCTSTNGEYDFMIVEFQDKKLFPNIIVKGIVINQDHDTLRGIPITLFNMTVKDITDSSKLDKKTGYYMFKLHSKNNYFASIEYDGSVYFSKPFKFDKYFTDYSFSNIIEIDPIVIGDSTLRQDIGDFKVFRNNYDKDEDDPIFDSVQNMFTVLEKMPLQNVSRINTSIGIKPPLISSIKESETPKIEEPNILTTPEPDPPKTVVINEITEIKDIIEYTDVVENPKVDIQVKVPTKNKNNNSADYLISSGIETFKEGDYSESLEKMKKAYEMYDTSNNYKKQVLCLEYIADAQYNSGLINDALEAHKESLSIIEENFGKKEQKAKQQEIAKIYNDLYYQDEALKYLEKSLKIDKELKNNKDIAATYLKMAEVYLQHNQQQKAIEILKEGLKYTKDEQQKAETYNKLGVSHHQLQEIITAIDYYNKAIQTASKIDDKNGLSKYQNNLGNAYYDIKKYNESLIHYKLSLGLHQQLLNEEGIAILYYNIGNVMRAQDKYNLAVDNFSNSINIALKLKNSSILEKNYFAMVLIYKVLKNYPLALEYYKKYFEMASPFDVNDDQLYHNKIKHVVSNEDISLLQAQMKRSEELLKFEKQKFDKELELLEQTQVFLKYTRFALAVLAAGILFLLILLLFRFRTRKKYYKQLSLQNAKILQKQEEITVQRENLTELNTLLEKLSIVASKTGNGVAIMNANTEFEWVNTTFETLYGNTLPSLLDFAWNETEKINIQTCIDKKQSVLYETQRKLNSQHQIWVQCMLTPIIIDDQIYKIISVESNIDNQKQAEQKIRIQRDEITIQAKEIEKQRDIAIEQKNEIEIQKNAIETTIQELQLTQKRLIESEKMASLGNLVAGVSHEINTPVGIGIAATSSLKSKTEEISELFITKKMKQSDLDNYLNSTQSAVQLIQSNLKRTGDLVKSFKRVSVDEMTDSLRSFNVQEYFNEIFTNFDAKLKDRNIEVVYDCPADLEIYNYPGAFAQIISNMTSNALLHAFKDKDSGIITIKARIIDNKFFFSFSDNGCGMTNEVIQKVFNPFFTTNMQTGTGLGMNIVYNVVTQKLQGDVSCNSKLDEGTTFTIDLPLLSNTENS